MTDDRSADRRPSDDADADADLPAGPCRGCGAGTSTAQRYCLECGALVGSRRLEPLEVLRERAGPTCAVAPTADRAPRAGAAPMAAAAAAILVAGVSGVLVTGGGDGARAAIVARAVAPVAPPAAAPAATTTGAAASSPASPASSEDGAGAADVPADGAAAADVPVDAGTAAPLPDDGAAAGGGDAPETTPDDPEIEPHVWLLALEGPRAQEAVDRIAEQGVRLTGVAPVGGATIDNAITLLTGAVPAGPAATGAGTAPTGAGTAAPSDASGDAATPGPGTASLPEELTTAGRTWRSYVDVQPGDAPALPGACTDPPVGDAAAATLAGRTPFGRLPGLRTDDACAGGTFSLETLTNDVSSGETLPSFSYATLGGCAPPERTVVALPDQVSDTVTAITESTEYQDGGTIVVTTVGSADPCPAPAATGRSAGARAASRSRSAAPVRPTLRAGGRADTRQAATSGAPAPAPAPTPAPTAILGPTVKPGTTVDVATDLRALTRLTAKALAVDPPGTSGGDDVPDLELPAAGG